MEGGRIIFSSPPIRSPMVHVRSFSPRAAITQPVDERSASGVNFSPAMTIGRHFPSSILFQEHISGPSSRADTALQVKLDKNQFGKHCPNQEGRNSNNYCEDLQRQLLYLPGSWYLFPSAILECKPSLTSSTEAVSHVKGGLNIGQELNENGNLILSGPLDALTLARTAVLASKEAAALADLVDSFEDSLIPNWEIGNEAPGKSLGGAYENTSGIINVKSRRLVQRRLKRRKIPRTPKVEDQELPISTYKHPHSKIISAGSDPNDPYRLFLSWSDKNPLLSPKEERELANKVHEMMRLEDVKRRLEMQFGREPTLAEWADALGVNCQNLQACIASGNSSRDKMISSNLRLVIHLAKIYQGKGLSIRDLLQEGSMGLMKSLDKFKPQANCRFATYAYWWIRQSMRKAIYLKSRTIRLPENAYALLARIKDARNSYKVVGHLPSNEDVAKDVGISVAKLESLLRAAQSPVSIQQRAWGSEDDVTFQEITADPEIEIPETIVTKQLMRQHVHSILTTLRPKERQIIRLRFGIHDGERKTLSEIGAVFGITKERVRQVESVALYKLKKCLENQGLHSYRDLLSSH